MVWTELHKYCLDSNKTISNTLLYHLSLIETSTNHLFEFHLNEDNNTNIIFPIQTTRSVCLCVIFVKTQYCGISLMVNIDQVVLDMHSDMIIIAIFNGYIQTSGLAAV